MKKTAVFLLILSILLHSVCAFAYEYKPYIGSDAVYATATSILNESGEEVEELVAGEKVCALVKIKGANENVTKSNLVLVMYSDSLLSDIAWSDVKSVSPDTSVYLKTDYVTVSDNNPSYGVFICDDLSANFAKPLYESSESTKEYTDGIKEITINGEVLKDFSPDVYEYKVTLPADCVNFPEIIAYSDDPMSKISVDAFGKFPVTTLKRGAVTTTATYETNESYAIVKDGESEYKIIFKGEEPKISAITPTYSSGTCDMGVVYGIREPDWEAAGVESFNTVSSVTVDGYSGKFNENNGVKRSSIFSRGGGYTRGIMYNIHPDLLGSHLITIYDDQSVKMSNLSFGINRGATLYVYSGYDLTADGFKKADDKVMYHYFSITSKFKTYDGVQLYYKDIYIGEEFDGEYIDTKIGETGFIVNLKINNVRPYVFVKFFDGNPIENVKYTAGGEESDSSYAPMLLPLLRTDSEDYTWYKNGDKATGGLDDGYLPSLGSGNVLYASFPFTDKNKRDASGYFVYDAEGDFVSGNMIPLPSTNVEKVSFSLKSASDVYVISEYNDDEITLPEGYEKTEGSVEIRISNTETKTLSTVYKKTYFTGDKTAENVELTLPGEDKSVMVVICGANLE